MPILTCEFQAEDTNIPSRIECIGADTPDRVNDMRVFLMRQAVNDAFLPLHEGNFKEYGKTSKEIVDKVEQLQSTVGSIQNAQPEDLPVDVVYPLVRRAVEVDDPNIALTDHSTGLHLYPYDLDRVRYSGDTIDATDIEALNDMTEDNEFIVQAVRHGCNFYGYTPEPRHDPKHDRDFTDHYTLGHLSEDGKFNPIVTVLDESHPVRKLQA